MLKNIFKPFFKSLKKILKFFLKISHGSNMRNANVVGVSVLKIKIVYLFTASRTILRSAGDGSAPYKEYVNSTVSLECELNMLRACKR